jgi:hypothetical protein
MIYSVNADANIAYTTDGSTPVVDGNLVTNGALYLGPITIGATTTIKAMAFHPGVTFIPQSGTYTNCSAPSSATYVILPVPQVAPPLFSPPATSYAGAQAVGISTTAGGASIRYTTDGSLPTKTHGTLYSGPVTIGITSTLRAIAFEAGSTDSPVTSGFYTIGAPPLSVAAPVFIPADTIAHTMAITSTTSGALIRYTTDGSIPNETAGTLYSAPVYVNAPMTLKAIAYKSGLADSSVTSANVTQPTVSITTPANGSTLP